MKYLFLFLVSISSIFAQTLSRGGGGSTGASNAAVRFDGDQSLTLPQQRQVLKNTAFANLGREVVTLANHGFSPGSWVIPTAAGWTYADSSVAVTARPYGVVESVVDQNTFVVVSRGPAFLPGAALISGQAYYSDSAGAISPNKPTTGYICFVGQAVTSSRIDVAISEPVTSGRLQLTEITDISSGSVISNALEIDGPPQAIPFHQVLTLAGPGAAPGQVLTWNQTQGRYLPADPSGSSSNDYARIPVAGDNIDFSAGLRLSKTLSGNWSPTISGTGTVRAPIQVWISNPSTHTVTWPGTIKWDGDVAPTQSTAGKLDVYEFYITSSEVLGRRIIAGVSSDTTAPTVSSANIDASGLVYTQVHSESVAIGGGGNGGLVLTASGGAATATYASGSGSTTLTWNLSRAIAQGETVTRAYTQPGNGIEDLAGNDLATFSGQAVANDSTYTSANTREGFEGGTNPAGWSGTGTFNMQSTEVALLGAQSAKVGSGSGAFTGTLTRDFGVNFSEVWIRLRFQYNARTPNPSIRLRNSAGTTLATVEFVSDRFRIGHGTTTASLQTYGAPALNVPNVIWLHYVAGTGANGLFEVWQVDNTSSYTRPTASAPGVRVLTVNTGTATDAVRQLRFEGPGTNQVTYVDDVLVQANEITSATP